MTMAKRSIEVSFKLDFITDDEDFLEFFDEADDEVIRECFGEGIEDKLTVQYDGVFMKLRDLKAGKEAAE